MYLREELQLYRKDGSSFTEQVVCFEKGSEIADALIFESRLIYCHDDEQGVFWFADTKEQVFEFPPLDQLDGVGQ